jgi:hypothetical protein
MAATLWFYVRDDKRQGPVDFEQLVAMLLTGQIPHNALVWHQGLREWAEADQIQEIAEQLPPPLPEAPKPKPGAAAEPAPLPRAPAEGGPAPSATPASPSASVSPAVPPSVSSRVEELRKRLEKDPGSRLFAQLAEELRKEGELEEAVAVCRTGLEKHPNYPSARITLARTLMDSGDVTAARTELEAVLQGAPDNILARKLLEECAEGAPAGGGPGAPTSKGGPEPSGKWWKSLWGGGGPSTEAPAAAPAAPAVTAVPTTPAPPAVTPAPTAPAAAPAAPAAPVPPAAPVATAAPARPTAASPAPPTPAPADAATPAAAPAPPTPVPPATALPVAVPEPEPDEDLPRTRPPDEDLPPIPLVGTADEPFELAAPYEGPFVRRRAPASGDTGPISVIPPEVLAAAAPPATAAAPASASASTPPAAAKPPAPTPAPPAPPATASAAPPPAPSPPAAAAPPSLPSPGRRARRSSPSDLTALLDEEPDASPRVFVPSLMPPTGSLADTDFPDLIHGLHDRRWTGTIQLNRGRVDANVTVTGGRLTFASSTNRDERLGELLLRREKITLRQYYEAGKAIRKGKRLGAILVEQGALDAKELVKAVVDHTQEVIYSVFQWTEGFYRLREGSDPETETITLKLSTANIILEGIRRITAWSRIERGVGGVEARYVRAEDYRDRLSEMTLTPEKLVLLAEHEGERDVETICRASQLSDFEVCRTIWAFRVIGVLRQVPPASPPSS